MPHCHTAILLMNTGTPQAPTPSAVRKYLKEFLIDPRIIDIPWPLRFLLVHGLIVPFRARRSAKAYERIWTQEGSPLAVHSQSFKSALSQSLGNEYLVLHAMRYGQPSLTQQIHSLCEDHPSLQTICLAPLFPQYASATIGSLLQKTAHIIHSRANIPRLVYLPPFYNHPLFIQALAHVAKPYLTSFHPDAVVFSYHGLPHKQILKSDLTSPRHCLQTPTCCEKPSHPYCYKAQCLLTSKALIKVLNLDPQTTHTSFQSRLGISQWIQPYTQDVLIQLGQKGVKRLAITCPAFVADCLETLEEIGIKAKEEWLKLGGEDFCLVPCLNTDPVWVDAFKTIVQEHI
jgi:protoporphyrin/coproporphyrin ferrochelatase